MIKVNLAKRKKAQFIEDQDTGAGGGPATFTSLSKGGGVKFDLEDLRDFPIAQIAIFLIGAIGASWWLGSHKEEEIAKMDALIATENREKSKLQVEFNKTKKFEKEKKELEENEFTIRTKIETIQKLVEDRRSSVDMLLTMSDIVPKLVWLSDLTISRNKVSISGKSPDLNEISEFIRGLNESAYFYDVTLVSTNSKPEGKEYEIIDFKVKASVRSKI